MTADLTADDVIRVLELIPHEEGGHFCEIYRDVRVDGGRGQLSSIYFLLRAGKPSTWHRFDATEVWCYHAGSPVELTTYAEGCAVEKYRIGCNLAAGEKPQVTVPAGTWQTAITLGDWSLSGCVVAPAFQYEGFELAPEGWSPSPQQTAAYSKTNQG